MSYGVALASVPVAFTAPELSSLCWPEESEALMVVGLR